MNDLNKKFNSFKSIICLNGEIPIEDFFTRYSGIPIIAADGAANKLLKINVSPTLIIGDFDSIDLSVIPAHIEVLHVPDQNSTDLEKCLNILGERKLFPCLIYGATGKETDHTLYNLSVIEKHSINHQMIFHDSAYKDKEKYGIFVSDYLSANLKVGAKISLLSFVHSSVTSKGLKWELINQYLSPGISSVRNLTKDDHVEIIVHKGCILVLLDFEPIKDESI